VKRSQPDRIASPYDRELAEGRARIRLIEEGVERAEQMRRVLEDLDGLDALIRAAEESAEVEE
jgi:hypothetical protein